MRCYRSNVAGFGGLTCKALTTLGRTLNCVGDVIVQIPKKRGIARPRRCLMIFGRVGRLIATTLIQAMLRQLGCKTKHVKAGPDRTIAFPFEVAQIKNTFLETREARSLCPSQPGQ